LAKGGERASVTQIIAKKRGITADTALRLGKWFDTTPEFWLNLQRSYELRKAARQIGREIDAIPTRSKEPA
jgi:addiction module HigA family antidote